jgi:Methylamine utilisation protein MauE
MIDPLIPRIIAFGLSLMLIGAAWHKLAGRQSFRAVLEDYRLFPAVSLNFLTWLVPAVEAILAAAWLFVLVPAVVAIASSLLLAAYATAIAINLRRGRAYIGCGCGFAPGIENQPLSWTLVVRNLLLIALALVTLLPQAQRSLGLADHALLVLALLVTVLLHSAVMQLLHNGTALRSWSEAHE